MCIRDREDLEQNTLPMCDDQVETKELPRNNTTEQVNSKIKNHEERNKIIKKTEEKEAKIKRILRPKKTRVTKELIEMTQRGLVNMIYFPVINRKEGRSFMKMNEEKKCATTQKTITCLLYTSRCV